MHAGCVRGPGWHRLRQGGDGGCDVCASLHAMQRTWLAGSAMYSERGRPSTSCSITTYTWQASISHSADAGAMMATKGRGLAEEQRALKDRKRPPRTDPTEEAEKMDVRGSFLSMISTSSPPLPTMFASEGCFAFKQGNEIPSGGVQDNVASGKSGPSVSCILPRGMRHALAYLPPLPEPTPADGCPGGVSSLA